MAPLRRPSDVAFFLASYARESLARLEDRAALPALAGLRSGMEDALGIRFDQRDGEHLFRSTLVQALFYGVFSAWVVHARAGETGFNWRASSWSLRVPVIAFLFSQIATPQALGPLDIVPLLDAAGATLDRIERDAFFAAFNHAQAVQYFYEPFLEYFDPELRRQLGVWYTPPEIVRYQVERVDRMLRQELGIAEGLADSNVWVLDPCCGTGSYIVAVLNRIRRTLEERGLGDLVAEQLKKAAMTRVVGFEIMTAPFVIAHWQVGEMLQDAPLLPDERAAIYLTNALTDWSEGEAGPALPAYDVLVQERGAAASVKRDRPILVILGNPPYNAYAGVSPKAEGGLVDAYKSGLNSKWRVKKFNLDDLFVRFFRVAERRIADMSGRGIVSFITNSSWLALPSFTVMRESFLRSFDRMWIENMHGDRTITEYGPDGRSSETVFAVDGFSPGIRQGVAISLLVRTGDGKEPIYQYRNDLDASDAAVRRADLLATLDKPDIDASYEILTPLPANRFLLCPIAETHPGYANWPAIDTLLRTAPLPGLLEKRGGGLVDIERDRLETKMRGYLKVEASFAEASTANPALAVDRARYTANATRNRLLREGFLTENIKRYCYFGFDLRWAYITPVRPAWNEPRPQLLHVLPDAAGFLLIRSQRVADPEGFPAYWTTCLADDHALHKDAYLIPVVDNLSGAPRPNLSADGIAYFAQLGMAPSPTTSALLLHHALAMLYSPLFLKENRGGLYQGWPHLPMPRTVDQLKTSAALGNTLSQLLNPDVPVKGVSSGKPRPELASIGIPSTLQHMGRKWELTGWGNRTEKGVTMPQRGHIVSRDYESTEKMVEELSHLLGEKMLDVGMGGGSFWKGIPEEVWECRIGGYQVLKKWLSYRDHSITGRPLTGDEVAHFQQSARRTAAILLLGPSLDESYLECSREEEQ